MSIAKCFGCGLPVDTDFDPASTDFPGFADKFVCERCRKEYQDEWGDGDHHTTDAQEHSTYWGKA